MLFHNPRLVGGVLFGMVAAAGIKKLCHVELINRHLLIITALLALGLRVTFRPRFTA